MFNSPFDKKKIFRKIRRINFYSKTKAANVSGMPQMFPECRKFFRNATYVSRCCKCFRNAANVSGIPQTFPECCKCFRNATMFPNTANVSGIPQIFPDATNVSEYRECFRNTTNVSGMSQMFLECRKCFRNAANVSGMPQMFLECRKCTWKKIGMPQKIMAMKYTIRKEPKSRKYKYLFS